MLTVHRQSYEGLENTGYSGPCWAVTLESDPVGVQSVFFLPGLGNFCLDPDVMMSLTLGCPSVAETLGERCRAHFVPGLEVGGFPDQAQRLPLPMGETICNGSWLSPLPCCRCLSFCLFTPSLALLPPRGCALAWWGLGEVGFR